MLRTYRGHHAGRKVASAGCFLHHGSHSSGRGAPWRRRAAGAAGALLVAAALLVQLGAQHVQLSKAGHSLGADQAWDGWRVGPRGSGRRVVEAASSLERRLLEPGVAEGLLQRPSTGSQGLGDQAGRDAAGKAGSSSASGDTPVDPAAAPRVALMFLSRGPLPLERMWCEFFLAASKIEPVRIPHARQPQPRQQQQWQPRHRHGMQQRGGQQQPDLGDQQVLQPQGTTQRRSLLEDQPDSAGSAGGGSSTGNDSGLGAVVTGQQQRQEQAQPQGQLQQQGSQKEEAFAGIALRLAQQQLAAADAAAQLILQARREGPWAKTGLAVHVGARGDLGGVAAGEASAAAGSLGGGSRAARRGVASDSSSNGRITPGDEVLQGQGQGQDGLPKQQQGQQQGLAEQQQEQAMDVQQEQQGQQQGLAEQQQGQQAMEAQQAQQGSQQAQQRIAEAKARKASALRRGRGQPAGSAMSQLNPSGVIAQQGLFTVYVHTAREFAFLPDSIFSGYQIPDRVEVEWGQYSVAEAERRLIRAALVDPRNQRFVLLSETCVPLYPPQVVYLQLLSEGASRVNACMRPTGPERWIPTMFYPGRVTPWVWRKSSQWVSLLREHAQLVAGDNELWPLFHAECYSYLQGTPGVPLPAHLAARVQNVSALEDRNCVSDEHYIPTLLAAHGRDNQTSCYDSLTYTNWVTRQWSPKLHFSKEVNRRLLNRLLKRAYTEEDCAAKAAIESSYGLFRRKGQEGTLSGSQAQYAPLQDNCYLFARKFAPNTLPWLMVLGRDCTNGTAISHFCLPH